MRKVKMKKILQSVLGIAAFALLSPGVSSAQTTTTDGTTTVVAAKPAPATSDPTAVTSVGFGAGVAGLASDANGNIYVSLQNTSKIVKLNGAGSVIGSFEAGRSPVGLIVDDAKGVLYALNNAENTVSKMALDGTPIATFKVDGDGPVQGTLFGGVLYLACERSNTVVRMSTDGLAQGSTEVGARPVWVAIAAPDAVTKAGSGVNVYVSCNKANQVWKLSTAGAVLAKYDTGRGPFGIAINNNGDVLVACFWDAMVLRLSGITGETMSKTAVGDGASALISYNSGNMVAVVENGTNSVARLSAADGLFVSRDKVDRSPMFGTATASGLWLGCTGNGTIARRSL